MTAASPLKSESFITLSRQEQSCDKIKRTKAAMFLKARALSQIFANLYTGFVILKIQSCKWQQTLINFINLLELSQNDYIAQSEPSIIKSQPANWALAEYSIFT